MSNDQIDLNELFLRDPLSYSDADIDRIVAEHRDRRTRFNLGDTKAGSAKPRVPKALQGLNDDILNMEVKL